MNANDSYSQIDKTKINICKNFNQVKELLNQNNRIREGFIACTEQKWDIDIAGILANDGEVSTGRSSVIINRNDNLQFYIRIVSTPPESFLDK